MATVFGCVLAAVLAVVMDQLIRLLELAARRRDGALAWIGAAGLLVLLGAGSTARRPSCFAPPPRVRRQRHRSPSSTFSSEVLKQQLRSAGFAVNQRQGMAEGVQFLALRGNQIDCCVNYTGNIWAVLMKQHGTRPTARTLYDDVRRFLRERYGVICLGKLGFENAYALAMNPKRAEELLGPDRTQWSVSRLAEQTRRGPVSISGDLQFFRRLEWRQLRDRYALRFREKKEADPTLMYGAVRDGAVDVIVAYSSDGRIEKSGLVLLQDDLGVLPSYDAILLVSARAAAQPEAHRGARATGSGRRRHRQRDHAGSQSSRSTSRGNRRARVALELLEAIAARRKKGQFSIDIHR